MTKENWKTIGTGYSFRCPDKKCELTEPKDHPLVVAFSGGRTSGMMLRYLLDTEEKQPIVLFANTGKERDETLQFVHDVETNWDIPIVWLQLTLVPASEEIIRCIPSHITKKRLVKQKVMLWYEQVNFATACRHLDTNSPFDKVISVRNVLPNAVARYCSAEMKVRTMQRYLWSKGIYKFRNAIGFRSDEPDRAYDLQYSNDRNKNCHLEFPLIKLGVVKTDVDSFWNRQSFDLGIQSYEGNCHMCFLKKRGSLVRLIHENPELANWWRETEELKQRNTHGAGGQFNRNFTINDLIIDSMSYTPKPEDTEDAMQCACNTSMSLAEGEDE